MQHSLLWPISTSVPGIFCVHGQDSYFWSDGYQQKICCSPVTRSRQEEFTHILCSHRCSFWFVLPTLGAGVAQHNDLWATDGQDYRRIQDETQWSKLWAEQNIVVRGYIESDYFKDRRLKRRMLCFRHGVSVPATANNNHVESWRKSPNTFQWKQRPDMII